MLAAATGAPKKQKVATKKKAAPKHKWVASSPMRMAAPSSAQAYSAAANTASACVMIWMADEHIMHAGPYPPPKYDFFWQDV
jgi:hypothetical protein